MNRFNRKFNIQRKRHERWQTIHSMLSAFVGVIDVYDGASPDDVQAMRVIHKKLYECSEIAKKHLEVSANYGRFLR